MNMPYKNIKNVTKTLMRDLLNLQKKIFLIFLIYWVSFSFLNPISLASAIETDNELDLLIRQIQKKSSSIQAFSCKFNQTRHLAIFSKPVVFSGILTLSKPDKLRWQVTDPIPSVILLNNTKGMRCSGHSKQFSFDLASGPKMHLIYKQFFQWLSGSIDTLHEFYEVKQLSKYRIALMPLNNNFNKSGNTLYIRNIESVKARLNDAPSFSIFNKVV